MSDQDRRRAGEALDAFDLDLHVEAQVLVERRERLVEKQDAGTDGERAGKRHALLLAARDLAWIPVGKLFELDQGQHVGDARALCHPLDAAGGEPIGDVVSYRHVREQCIILEDDPHLAPVGRQIVDCPGADDDVSFALQHETRDDAQQRRLAAARWTEQSNQLASLDVKRDAIDRRRPVVLVAHRVERERKPG